MDEHPGDQPGDEPVGSLGEEATRLLGALGSWARDARDGGLVDGWGSSVAAAAHQVDEHLATGGETCRWCPVCRAVHAVRTTNPEIREQLAVAATALLQAGTSFLAALQSQPTAGPGERPTPRGGVEHIDLVDDVDEVDEVDVTDEHDDDGES